MRDYSESSELMERIINKYNITQNFKRNYGTDFKISRAEIHTINIIGENPEINITQIAEKQGVTKGAVSQMIKKLIDKGFLIKTVSPESEAEVRLSLTESGVTAFNVHKEYHKTANEELFKVVRYMPDEEYEKMMDLLKKFEELLDNSIMMEK